jgi:hypothetical protein
MVLNLVSLVRRIKKRTARGSLTHGWHEVRISRDKEFTLTFTTWIKMCNVFCRRGTGIAGCSSTRSIDMAANFLSFGAKAKRAGDKPNGRIDCLPNAYRVSHDLRSLLRESVTYVKIYRYNPKHLYPKLNGYGDNGQREVWSSWGSTHCTCQLTV